MTAYSDLIVGTTGVTNYWQFESNGNATVGTAAMTIAAGYTTISAGKDGNALTADSSATKTGSFTASVANTFFNNTYSIEMWFKVGSHRAAGQELMRMSDSLALEIQTNGTLLYYYNSTQAVSVATLDDNLWHHLVLTRDGALLVRMYIDGTQVASFTAGAGAPVSGNLYVAGSQYTTQAVISGQVDELALYNVALAPATITSHYNGPPVGTNGGYTAQAITASVAMPNVSVWTPNVPAIADTYTFNGSLTNNGASTLVSIMDVANGNSYFQFDVQPTPGGQTLASAFLNLTVSQWDGTMNVNLYAVDGPWTESINYTNKPAAATKYATKSVPLNSTSISIDITTLYNEWLNGTRVNYGVMLQTDGTAITSNVFSREYATVASRPKVALTMLVPVSVTFSATPMAASILMPSPVVTAVSNATVNATAMTASIAAVQPVASTGRSVTIGAIAMNVSVDFPGGVLANNVRFIEPIALSASFPGGVGLGGSNGGYIAQAMTATLNTVMPTFSNQTDRVIATGFVALNIEMPTLTTNPDGTMAEDRWYRYLKRAGGGFHVTPQTKDTWLRFEEFGGTIAFNEVNLPGNDDNATYIGNPTFRLPAINGRHAIGLDGIDDFVEIPSQPFLGIPVGTPAVPPGTGWSFETVMRTTADSGTIFTSLRGTYSLEVTPNGMRIVTWDDVDPSGGVNIQEFYLNIPTKINDGEWHHIWFGFGTQDNFAFSVQVDGKSVFNRNQNPAWSFTVFGPPVFIGSRPASYANTGTNQSGFTTMPVPRRPLKADFMEAIVRMGEAYGRDQAIRSWYELKEHTVVESGTPAAIGVDTTRGARAKGNQKRMLVLFGNYDLHDSYSGTYTGFAGGAWSGQSVFAREGTSFTPAIIPGTFDDHGYKVYSVHMFDPNFSTPGIVTQAGERAFFDDETGDTRYIDITKDLAVDVREFDVIHVLNWPVANLGGRTPGGEYEEASNIGFLDEFKYDKAKERLKNDIRKAVDMGCGLWIAEAQMAIDFGIAKGWDHHGQVWSPNSYDQYLDHFYFPSRAGAPYTGAGYAASNGQIRRRIVSTANNFSEFETYFVGERIYYETIDRLTAHSDQYAHNLVHLPSGLTTGSEFSMVTGAGGVTTNTYRGTNHIYSLQPNGIVGQVIAKEQASVPTINGIIPNPYAENVTTVLLDRGTILEGKPLGGRIFVETMDNYWSEIPMRHTALAKTYMNGSPVTPGERSNWDFDSRRNRELFFWGSYQFMRKNNLSVVEQIGMVDATNVPAEFMPFVGMNDRGLNWLGVQVVSDGSAKAYSASMEASVSMPTPTVTVVKNAVIGITPMTVKAELRKPVNIADPSVQVNADTMQLGITFGGYQRVISVTPMGIMVAMGEHTIRGEGEDIVFYLRDEDITLYLGTDD